MARRRRDGRRDNENLIFIAFSPSVIFDKMTAPSSEGAYVGQPQGLSLRAVRNYLFTFLRLAKDCKGSNPINNLQKNNGTVFTTPYRYSLAKNPNFNRNYFKGVQLKVGGGAFYF